MENRFQVLEEKFSSVMCIEDQPNSMEQRAILQQKQTSIRNTCKYCATLHRRAPHDIILKTYLFALKKAYIVYILKK